jgi:hypothetical protein
MKQLQTLEGQVNRIERAMEILDEVVLLEYPKAVIHNDSRIYHVDEHEQTCECPDHKFRFVKCKHIWAVQMKRKGKK